MSGHAERNVPCQTCRTAHVSCKWPEDSSADTCLRCARLSVVCSGPRRKTKPACESCRRVRARCDWDDDGPCRRCKRLARECPSDPSLGGTSSSSTSRSGSITSTALRSETYRRSEIGLLASPMRQMLVEQGLRRLQALDCGFQYGMSGVLDSKGLMVQELVDIMACISCLKYSGGVQIAGTIVDVRPLEEITNRQWLAGPLPKASFQDDGLRDLYGRAFSLFPKICSISSPDRQTLRQMLSALRLAWRLNFDEMEEPELARCILAFVVLKAVPEFESEWEDPADKVEHAGSALQLALREAEMAIVLGQPSYISETVLQKFIAIKAKPTSSNPPDVARLMGITAQNATEITAYLWDELLESTINEIHLQTRRLADLYPNTVESLASLSATWTTMENLLSQLDTLTMTITVFNSYTEPSADGRAVLAVLRSIGCVELCLLLNVVYSLVIARRLISSLGLVESAVPDVPKWTTTVVQRLLRISDVVMTHECPISQLYHVLQMTAKIMDVGRDFLLPVVQCLDPSPQQVVMDVIKTSAFWDCPSKHLVGDFEPRVTVVES